MKLIKSLIYLVILFIPLSGYSQILLNEVEETAIKGDFNLIIYGNAFTNDPETFIILDRTEEKTLILPYSSSHKYRIYEKISEGEVMQIIKDIFNNPSISFIKYREIKDSDLSLGFEIKPVYYPWIFGISEPLETTYKKELDKIYIFIRLNPRVEKQLYNGNNVDRDF